MLAKDIDILHLECMSSQSWNRLNSLPLLVFSNVRPTGLVAGLKNFRADAL